MVEGEDFDVESFGAAVDVTLAVEEEGVGAFKEVSCSETLALAREIVFFVLLSLFNNSA